MGEHTLSEITKAGGITTVVADQPDDLFLVCASYEDRCTAASGVLSKEYSANKTVIYFNDELQAELVPGRVAQNMSKLTDQLASKSNTLEFAKGSWLQPERQFSALKDALNLGTEKREPYRITVDVTTFHREALLTMMALLGSYYPDVVLRVLYVTPMEHGEWLSRGFRSVRSIIGFPGVQQPILPTIVIALSGFESDRVLRVIEEYEPAKVFLGIGNPPTRANFLDRNKEEQKLILSRQDVENFEFPANSIYGARDAVLTLIRSLKEKYNIVIAPMSTKLSTLGTFLAAQCHPEVQLTYCLPGEYNVDAYSRGAEKIYIEEMPLSI